MNAFANCCMKVFSQNYECVAVRQIFIKKKPKILLDVVFNFSILCIRTCKAVFSRNLKYLQTVSLTLGCFSYYRILES
jgi:hypothetical protein